MASRRTRPEKLSLMSSRHSKKESGRAKEGKVSVNRIEFLQAWGTFRIEQGKPPPRKAGLNHLIPEEKKKAGNGTKNTVSKERQKLVMKKSNASGAQGTKTKRKNLVLCK